jgi:hypothetical protein
MAIRRKHRWRYQEIYYLVMFLSITITCILTWKLVAARTPGSPTRLTLISTRLTSTDHHRLDQYRSKIRTGLQRENPDSRVDSHLYDDSSSYQAKQIEDELDEAHGEKDASVEHRTIAHLDFSCLCTIAAL